MTRFTSSHRVIPALILFIGVAVCLALGSGLCYAQTGHVPVPMRSTAATRSTQGKEGANLVLSTKTVESSSPQQKAACAKDSVDFGKVPTGQVDLQICAVTVAVGNPIINIDIQDSNNDDPSPLFKAEKDKKDQKDDPSNPCRSDLSNVAAGTCNVVIGFAPADDHSSSTATLTIEFLDGSKLSSTLNGTGDTAPPCMPLKRHFLPLWLGFRPGELYPLLPTSISPDLAMAIYNDFNNPIRKSVVNCYYSTNNSFSYFNQFQQIYNAASGASTVNAQLGSLNFSDGMQLTIATNPQIASSNSSSSTSISTTPVLVPTLSAAAAAQGAQNILNGGTIFGFDLYPFLSRQGDWMMTIDGVLREGVDLQKFNNTSITATNPATHTFVGMQGYLQYNSSNNAANSTGPAGSIFLGGMYGYSLMNHTYSLENGFGGRINSQLGQVSAGVLLNGVVKLAVSRGFGPSQKYIDSTSMAQKVTNNFQTWSIGIAYQSSGSGKAK
jgi:hypothetical protein